MLPTYFTGIWARFTHGTFLFLQLSLPSSSSYLIFFAPAIIARLEMGHQLEIMLF
jgi:hypothetical protein